MTIPRKPVPSTTNYSNPQDTTQSSSTKYDQHNTKGPFLPVAKKVTPTQKARAAGWWSSLATMLAFFLLGIVFALAHHFYYDHLNGTEVLDKNSQQQAIIMGTTLAFLTKSSLTAAVLMAHTQYIWVTMRNKAISVNGIDSMVAVANDITYFLSWEMLHKAKLASLLAVIAWCLPLSTLISPATLSVKNVNEVNVVPNFAVPTVDFGYVSKFAALGTCTPGLCEVSDELGSAIQFRYPNILTTRLSVATATTGSILPMSAHFPNSSYTVDFYGPAMKCDISNSTTGEISNKLMNSTIPECESTVGVMGAFYFGAVPGLSRGSFFAVDLNSLPTSYNHLNDRHPYAPELWLTTSSKNINLPGVDCIGRGGWRNTTCALYNTSYSVEFEFSAGVQSTTIKSLEYVAPMAYHQAIPAPYEYGDGDGTWAAVLSYQAIWLTVSKQLVGTLGLDPVNGSNVLQTPIIGGSELADYWSGYNWGVGLPPEVWRVARNRTLDRLVEELSQNITLSLFSSSTLWSTIDYRTDVKVMTNTNRYSYDKGKLFTSYTGAISAALFCVCVGIYAFKTNGINYNNSFSTILRLTRNPDLDELTTVPEGKLGKLKLRFGVVQGRTDNEGYEAFGLHGTLRD